MERYGMSVTDDRGPIDPRYVTYARYMRPKPSRYVTSSVTPYMKENNRLGDYRVMESRNSWLSKPPW